MTAPTPIFQLEGADGIPLIFAEMYFTLTGTTTPATVYTDAALAVPHAYPVVADDTGLFPAIYLDPSVIYRLRLIADGGDLMNPLIDTDPVNQALTVTAADLADSAIETKLGYTPVDPDNAVFTSEARINYTNPLAVLHEDSVGYRVRPTSIKDASYTIILDDAGRMFLHDDTSTPTITVDTNANAPFPIGTVIYFMNVNTGVVTFARESGVELRIAGAATNQDVAVAQWGSGELVKYDTDKWMMRGNGLS